MAKRYFVNYYCKNCGAVQAIDFPAGTLAELHIPIPCGTCGCTGVLSRSNPATFMDFMQSRTSQALSNHD